MINAIEAEGRSSSGQGRLRNATVDATAVIYLYKGNRLGVFRELQKHQSFRFHVPDEVKAEVTISKYPDQASRVKELLAAEILLEVTLDSEELALYVELRTLNSKNHAGECACLAIAKARNWEMATDDKRFIPVVNREIPGRLIQTRDLLNMATNAEARAAKTSLLSS